MNCRRAAADFSQYLEGALELPERERLEGHLAACESCRQSLRDTRIALVALRASGREEPPAGLAGGIIARLAAAGPPDPVPAPAARRTFPWPHALAAAALLIACLAASFAYARRGSGVAALEGRFAASLAAWERDRAALLGDLEAARRSVAEGEAAYEALGKSMEAKGARLRALEETARDLGARLQSESRRIAVLENDVALSREEARRLSGELAAAPPPAREVARPAAGLAPEAGGPPPAVVFRRREGRLEVEVRGPLEAVIPQLFAVAWDDSDPELAGIALGALEAYLAPRGERNAFPPAERQKSGLSEFFDRRLAGFASFAPGGDAPLPEPSGAEGSPRRRRLAALERIWQSMSPVDSPNLGES